MQSTARLTADPRGVARSNPSLATYTTFVEVDNEILFTVILHSPFIQGGQLSVTDETMCTKH